MYLGTDFLEFLRELAEDCEEGGAREGGAGAAEAQELDRGLEQVSNSQKSVP